MEDPRMSAILTALWCALEQAACPPIRLIFRLPASPYTAVFQERYQPSLCHTSRLVSKPDMEILTPKMTRRSTRVRVEIPVTITSMDRRHPFSAACVALVVSLQGGGIRAPQALPVETPVLLSNLPGGGSATAYVANCLPLGKDGKYFLIGVSLYNHGNVWGISDPPEDWTSSSGSTAASAPPAKSASGHGRSVWPYNLFPSGNEAHPGRK
jgi:hypothetical protein